MKKVIVFLSCLCMIFTLVGCGDKGHTCSFDTAWQTNDTHHWHACTGENCTEKDSYAEHDFTNGNCVCGKEKPVDPATLEQATRLKYQTACNNIVTNVSSISVASPALLSSPSFIKGVRLSNNEEPVHEVATIQGVTMIKGVVTYVKLLGDMMVNPSFQLTDKAVVFTASFTAPSGFNYSETFTALLSYDFDEENDKIEMTWDVDSTIGSTVMNIFLYMTIDYDFETGTLTGFHLKSVQPGIAFSAKYDGETASTFFVHGTTELEETAWYFDTEKQALADKEATAINLNADFTAEYTVAMMTMNPQFSA